MRSNKQINVHFKIWQSRKYVLTLIVIEQSKKNNNLNFINILYLYVIQGKHYHLTNYLEATSKFEVYYFCCRFIRSHLLCWEVWPLQHTSGTASSSCWVMEHKANTPNISWTLLSLSDAVFVNALLLLWVHAPLSFTSTYL